MSPLLPPECLDRLSNLTAHVFLDEVRSVIEQYRRMSWEGPFEALALSVSERHVSETPKRLAPVGRPALASRLRLLGGSWLHG